jgi:hypothetical protein
MAAKLLRRFPSGDLPPHSPWLSEVGRVDTPDPRRQRGQSCPYRRAANHLTVAGTVCDSHALPYYPDANTRHRNAQRTSNGNDFSGWRQRRRAIFRRADSAVTTYIPAKAFGIGISGRQVQTIFFKHPKPHFTFHCDGSSVTSHSSVRRMPSSCGTRLCQPSIRRAFDTSIIARAASTLTA